MVVDELVLSPEGVMEMSGVVMTVLMTMLSAADDAVAMARMSGVAETVLTMSPAANDAVAVARTSGIAETVPMTMLPGADDAVAMIRMSGKAETVPMSTSSTEDDDVLVGDKSGTLGKAFSDTERSISGVLIVISAGLSLSSPDDESEVLIL
jgi:hypothetical protein